MTPARLIEKQVLFAGKRVRLEIHHHEKEDGSRTKHEVIVHPGAVVVLPLLEDGQVLMIRNRRPAIGRMLLELPAGTLEKGEDPMNCAGRELQEETGFLAGRIRPLGSFFSSPGILSEKLYAFVADRLEKTQQSLDDGEEIELEPMPLDDVIEMCGDGRIDDGKTIATMFLYQQQMKRAATPSAPDENDNDAPLRRP